MIRLIMHGCNGKMGQVISNIVAQDSEAELVAGIDMRDDGHNPYPVFTDINACDVEADALIDFSAAPAVDAMLDYCVARGLPCVLCTTGLSPQQLARVEEASGKVAVLKSANMSLGINLLLKLLKDAAGVLAPAGYDIEIVEKHHNQKVDAPSGTAKLLLEAIDPNHEYTPVYGRQGICGKRGGKEIGVHAIRGGTEAGTHTVSFFGADEVVEITHRASSRQIFVNGALHMARKLVNMPKGRYNLQEILFGGDKA